MTDHLGQQLGNYRLVSLLGQGGYAEVYLGQHVRLDLQAAIKVLHTHLTDQEAEHFYQEAQTIARLTHPSIVRIFDFDVQEGVPFLVMDYAPHGSLRQRYPKDSILPLPQIVSYVKQVASALQYAHERKFIHRDIKPENMLLGRNNEILLSDFGLAALAHSSGSLSTKEAAGTLFYMAPEQIEGHPRAASDQYALGVVVYEWLCGNRPFEGSITEVIVQHLNIAPPPLRERVPAIPPELEQVVLRTLAKDPKQRFASVQDFAIALDQTNQVRHAAPDYATAAIVLSQHTTLMEATPSADPLTLPTQPAMSTSFSKPLETPQQALPPEPMGKVPTHLTPLVGRQLEWLELQTLWQNVSTRGPHLLVLSGEAGIGKTRLAEELIGWIAQQGFSTARAACYAVEGELAYAPVSFWLRAPAIRSRLSSLPALWLSEVARFAPQILVEYPGLPPPSPLTESWQRQRLFEALARTILAARQPLLLLLDDLQWCDQETLAWLHYLLRFDPTARLLIVGTLRVEELTEGHPLQTWLATLQREGQLTQLDLEGLSSAETAALAVQLAGHELDPDAANRLYQETEGNALFVVETMRMIHEQVEAREGYSSAELRGLKMVQVLPTIQAVITARLAKLSPEARELATFAAVIGRAFGFELLVQVSKREEGELLEEMDELWQRRILHEAQGDRYDFSHAKIREVIYAELRPPRRRLLHRRVAEALEMVYANNLDEVSGQIASHYERAGMVEQALTYYQRAAAVAQHVYANEDAINLLSRALELLALLSASAKRDTLELSLQLALAPLYRVTKGWAAPELEHILDRALALCDTVGDDAQRAQTLYGLQSVYVVQAKLERVQMISDELQTLYHRSLGAASMYADMMLAGARLHLGRIADANAQFAEIIATHDPDQLLHLQESQGVNYAALAQAWQAHALWCLGYPQQALSRALEAVKLVQDLDQPFNQALVSAYLALLQQLRAEEAVAREQAEQALTLTSQYQAPYYQVWADILVSYALALEQPNEEGIGRLRSSITAFKTSGARLRLPYYLSLLADVCGRAERIEEGLASIDEALTEAGIHNERWWDAELYRLRGEFLLLQSAHTSDVEATLLRAVEIARSQQARSLELRATMSLARLWIAQKRSDDARSWLGNVYSWFTEGFETPDLQAARLLLAQL